MPAVKSHGARQLTVPATQYVLFHWELNVFVATWVAFRCTFEMTECTVRCPAAGLSDWTILLLLLPLLLLILLLPFSSSPSHPLLSLSSPSLFLLLLLYLPPPPSSTSIGTTAHCGLGLSNNVLTFFPICHQLSPSSHSQHLKISFCFLFPSFPGSSPSSRPFQFLSEDLFGHPILLHSL